MLPEAEPRVWDLLTLIAWWNLYGLPVLLIVFALVVAIRRWNRPAAGSKQEPSDDNRALSPRWRLKAIRTIALIHLGLAVRAGIGLVQELLTLRAQGIPQSFPVTGIVIPAAEVMANLAIGHGLWRLRSWGRRAAIVWDALAAFITALVTVWQWKYRATVRLDQWPDYLVADVLPWFLLVVMLLPGTGSLFKLRRDVLQPGKVASPGPGQRRLSFLWLLAVLLLIIVISTLLVDAADWLVRLLNGPSE
jgi:hypothetical protein